MSLLHFQLEHIVLLLFRRKLVPQTQPHPAQLRNTAASRCNAPSGDVRSRALSTREWRRQNVVWLLMGKCKWVFITIYANRISIQAYRFEIPVRVPLAVNVSNG